MSLQIFYKLYYSMWSFDIICDVDWLKDCKGDLGEPSLKIKASSNQFNIFIDILLFADDTTLRHVRFILHTPDQKLAQKCINANLHAWIDSIETGVILQTQKSFVIPKVEGTYSFLTILGSYDGGKHQTAHIDIATAINAIKPFDINTFGVSLAMWKPELHVHLHYFRRMVDPALPLEFRWLNAYKLFEWHFAKRHLKRVGNKSKLAQSKEWQQFVNGYKIPLSPYLKNKQTPFRLIETVRAMVAHAFLDVRTEQELILQPNNLIELTYPVMRDMVNDLLNILKDQSLPVKLTG